MNPTAPLPRFRTLAVAAFAVLAALFIPSSRLLAGTAIDLSGRIQVDGFTSDYLPDETLFQRVVTSIGELGGPEESTIDSRWGRFDDLNNIRVTWDANFVYVAVEGYIFDNNVMIFFDTLPSPDGQAPGWSDMSSIVGGWRRAVSFDNGLAPDLFLSTWDGNTTPQLWQYTGPNNDAQVAQGTFPTVATFSRDLPNRAMEAAIPWDTFFLGKGKRVFNAAYGDTVYQLPEGVHDFKLAAWITTGSDGLGGPDSAPDNLSGHQVDSAVPVVLDNFIRIVVDSVDASGNAVPDGFPDFGVPVRIPSSEQTRAGYETYVRKFFFVPPPIRGQALQLSDMTLDPKAVAPELGDQAHFRFTVTPHIDDPRLRESRRVNFSARIFDVTGKRVRTIYENEPFTLDELDQTEPPVRNLIDGKDDSGRMLAGGIYVLQVILEPGQDQVRRAFAVAR